LKLFALLATLSVILIACSGETASPPQAATATPTAVPELPVTTVEGSETVTLKLLSFNVLYGAGHDRRFDMNIPARFHGVDRVQQFLDYVKAAQPDVLAVQEAGGWIEGARPVAAQIAAELGMSYVVAQDPWDLHVMLFSRYPIIDAAAVTRTQGFNGVVLVTKLLLADNLPLNVVVPHLYSMSSQTRACQVEALKAMTEPLTGRTVLIGDMNFRPESGEARVLQADGWQLVAWQPFWRVDQIWVDATASYSVGGWWDSLPNAEGISDHLPAGAEVTFSIDRELPRVEQQPASGRVTPRTLSYVCDVPAR
jgi:endonuclease/exonuclease/phosphatase family metal-dependent hydrolase